MTRLTSVPLRLIAVVAAVALAYRFSLGTLADGWRYESPLADLILVPPIAAGLLVLAARRHHYVGAIRLGRADLVAGALLTGLALSTLIVAPVSLSKEFWAMRLDLLSLPLLAAAAIVLLFGLRALISFAYPLLFLALCWPLPYAALLEHVLDASTRATGAVVSWALVLLPVAHAAPVDGDPRYVVDGPGGSFAVSIASSCAGISSVLGSLLVGLALLYVVRGKLTRRLAWLVTGLALVWLLNAVRIVAILTAGRWLGEHAALDVLHPVAGLLALNLGVLLELLALPLFGLRLRALDEAASDSPLARVAPLAERPTPRRLAPRAVFVGLAVAAVGLADGQLSAVASGFESSGIPAIRDFAAATSVAPGWTASPAASMDWSTRYFGQGSSWIRYRVRPTAPAVTGRDRFTIWADAVDTPSLGALLAHGVRDCYAYHRYDVQRDEQVSLGHGVTGELIVFEANAQADWHAVVWEWPVETASGSVRHERMVLLASSQSDPLQPPAPTAGGAVRGGVLAALNVAAPRRDTNPRLSDALLGIAGQLVAGRIERGRA